MAFSTELIIFVVGTLLAAFFVHLAASFSLGGTPFYRAALVAGIGNLVGLMVWLLFGQFAILAYIIVLVCWLAICATVYRTSVWKALFIGLFAYLLWVLTRSVVNSVMELVRN